jgi:hypothetical protein
MEISEEFESIILALDRSAFADALQIADELSNYVPNVRVRIPSAKDFNSVRPEILKDDIIRMVAC